MIIKKVGLENIRSYVKQEIEFPTGSILLSGDVGSGKSTILQAIDFALFGISKEVSGLSLLRNGASKGSVILEFEIDGKNYQIKRVLKRGSSVNQEAGFFVQDNESTSLSPVELKQKILDLLQYPSEMLNRKIPLFRCTVYTPQEEMKQILFGPKEYRLDLLRKVFGVDNYRVIRENAELVVQIFKQQQKLIKARTEELPRLDNEIEKLREETAEVNKRSKELEPSLKEIKKKVENKKDKIADINKNLKEFEKASAEAKAASSIIERIRSDINSNTLRLEEIKNNIALLKCELKVQNSNLVGDPEIIEEEISAVSSKIQKILMEKASLITALKNSEELCHSLSSLSVCPICKQSVTEDYKKEFQQNEVKKRKEIEDRLQKFSEDEQKFNSSLEEMKSKLKELQKISQQSKLIEMKSNMAKELEKEEKRLETLMTTQKKEIGDANKRLVVLMDSLKSREDTELIYKKFEDELRELEKKERALEIENAGYESMLMQLQRQIAKLEKHATELKEIQSQGEKLGKLQFWFEEHLIPLAEVIEKNILQRVHHDFHLMVERWFSLLMDADGLKMRLDEEFSPVIEQNGHDIEYQFLSGGEQTAAALAYRLALNQVITSLHSSLKTRHLLILDEPTDGFSEDQLDRIKLVLDEISAKQIVIVSHESKIESMVQNVIRVEKNGHMSEVAIS